ncbi:tape measure protein [Moellerella wisconsensis]|uniref:Tape measure protein n=1 Tax=Moellerella wisconsensis TaxID=158849 RepID=A0ACD3YA25_9GAMM|nr:tape measure protein [Moellerella wisconsensis]UNH39988.1 tape measure protein [Moellerella wisconsensis]
MAEQTSRLAIILDSTGAKRSADTLATSLERLTTQGEKATGSTDELGFSFKRLATSAAGALSVGIVIKTVDEWGQVAARMKNALRSVEGDIKNYSAIQERFLTISNRNGKNIADTQLLYIGAASSMQELGYSTTQTVDYIESLSSAMTANASSVNEVLSMQNALNKAQIAGKVAGENWNSIMNATPTLLGDIAKQLEKQNGGIKVTEMEVKKLAADGKISFKLFADAIMAAKDANNALADSMDNTVADGLTRVTNSAKAYYGELNQSLGITRAISASLATVSDNFGSVSTVLTGIVGIGAARYFGNLSNSIYDSTKKAAENALTNRKLAVDKVNTARATLIQAQNERAAAIAAVESTKAQQSAATTEVQRISLKTQLANQTAALTAATKAETVATTELAAAQGRLSVANNLVKGGLALVGGPVGLAMLAAGGMYAFATSMQQAKADAIDLSRGLSGLIEKLKEMTREQKLIKIGDLENSYVALESAIRKAEQAKAEAFRGTFGKAQAIEKETAGTREHTKAVEEAERAQRKYEAASASLSVAKDDLSRAQNTAKVIQADLNGTLQQGADLLRAHTQTTLPNGASAFKSFGFDVNTAANALGKFNAASLQINFSDGGSRLKKQLERDLALAKKTGEERARLQAKYAAEDAGETDERAIGNLQDLAALVYSQNEAQKELNKTTKQSRDAGQEMLKQLREQALAIEDQLRYSGKLTDAGFQRLSFERQIAAIKAKGKKATDDEKSLLANQGLVLAAYKELEVRQETAKLMEEYRSQQTSIYSEMKKGNTLLVERLTLLDKLKAAGKLTDGEYDTSRNNAIKNTKSTLPQSVTSVTGNLSPTGGELSGTWGGMQQQMNELQKAQEAVNQWQDQQLESYREYYEGKANLTAEYEARIAETQKTARQANDQIEAQRREINRAATESIMDSIVSITRDGFGEQSAVYKAAFVANKAFAIAQSMLSIQQGIAMAAANPFPMNLAAMASVAAQTASIVSNIQGIAGVGFANGGYTGKGAKYDPRGVVHAGEFVFNKEATDKIGVPNLYKMMNSGSIPMDALKNDQYAMKNIHPANQTTNNSSEENTTKVVTIHAAPITIQGNPDDKTIALIEQSQKKAIMDCYKAISNDIAEGKGNVSKALGTGWNTKRKTG